MPARPRGRRLAVFVDADSHPDTELFADVAEQIKSGKCLAGGATVRLDEKHFVAGCVTCLWNCASDVSSCSPARSFLSRLRLSAKSRIQQRTVCAEELELSQRLKKLARGGQGSCHFAPASARDFRAQDAPLHHARAPSLSGQSDIQQRPRAGQPRKGASVV